MTQALSYLSARERACVVLSQRDHLNYEQIADLLAIGVQEVRDAFKSGITKMVEENHKAARRDRQVTECEIEVAPHTMTQSEFRAVLDWYMCSDHWAVNDQGGNDSHSLVTQWLDRLAKADGWSDWFDAYQRVPK